MFSLARSLEKSVEINEKEYELDLSFDNVLLVFDVLKEEELDDRNKVELVLELLFVDEVEFDTIDMMVEVYTSIMVDVILQGKAPKKECDLAGNEIEPDEAQEQLYSLEEDAQYIYASFLQDYKINLFHEQGKLHWFEFNALLASLSETTMFKRVIDIRQRQPHKDMSAEEKKNLMELKRTFALTRSQEEIEFEAMDLAQKREYALRKMKEESD